MSKRVVGLSLRKRSLLTLVSDILLKFPDSLRYQISDVFFKTQKLKNLRVDLENAKYSKLTIKPPKITRENHNCYICLTHDVDYLIGYNVIPRIYTLEMSYDIRSCFNLLTHSYPLEKGILRRLTDNGFEIGLHGDNHDIAFGYRKEELIRKKLIEAIKRLSLFGLSPKGFRAPSFSISENLLRILNELNFVYDSSIPLSDISYVMKGVNSYLPYRYQGLNIWEIPVTFQDTRFIRAHNLSDRALYHILQSSIYNIYLKKGVSMIILHPCIIRKRWTFFENVLNFISGLEDVYICTPFDLINKFKKEDGCFK